MFTIEKNIPLPARARSEHYPLKDMEVGDSFLVPSNDKAKTAASVRSCSQRHRASGANFSVRMVAEGVRVWRTA